MFSLNDVLKKCFHACNWHYKIPALFTTGSLRNRRKATCLSQILLCIETLYMIMASCYWGDTSILSRKRPSTFKLGVNPNPVNAYERMLCLPAHAAIFRDVTAGPPRTPLCNNPFNRASFNCRRHGAPIFGSRVPNTLTCTKIAMLKTTKWNSFFSVNGFYSN